MSTQFRMEKVKADTKIGSFVCVTDKKYQTKDMSHPLWQAIGRVARINTEYPSDPIYEVEFPSQIQYKEGTIHYFYSERLRVASAAEGYAAFMLDQWAYEEKQRASYDRRFEQAKAEAAKAQVAASDL